jgi:hypothetical protein
MRVTQPSVESSLSAQLRHHRRRRRIETHAGDLAQPRRVGADTAAMIGEPALHPAAFYTTLWIGALMLAGNAALDPFPAELDELAKQFFTRFRPIAKA